MKDRFLVKGTSLETDQYSLDKELKLLQTTEFYHKNMALASINLK